MAAPLVAAAALAALLVGGARAERGGPWSAGWGFASHGGVPPQPANLQSYQLNRSVVGYFVANNTGLASAEESPDKATGYESNQTSSQTF